MAGDHGATARLVSLGFDVTVSRHDPQANASDAAVTDCVDRCPTIRRRRREA
jgi:hypothetical protein